MAEPAVAEQTMEEWAKDLERSVGTSVAGDTYEVSRERVRMFARVMKYDDPIYFDVEAAKREGHPDLPCPPGYLGARIYNPFAESHGLRGLPGLRRLYGGMDLTLLETVYAGDELTTVNTPTSVTMRQSKLGLMLIHLSETAFTRVSDQKVVARKSDSFLFY